MRRDQPEGAAATPAEAAGLLREHPLNPRSHRILVLPLRRLLLPPGRPTLRRVVRPFAGPRPVVAGPALRPALDPVSLIPDHDKLGLRAVRALWATMRRLSAGLIPTANKIFPPLRRSLHHAAPITPQHSQILYN
jgi:hypothetical protein